MALMQMKTSPAVQCRTKVINLHHVRAKFAHAENPFNNKGLLDTFLRQATQIPVFDVIDFTLCTDTSDSAAIHLKRPPDTSSFMISPPKPASTPIENTLCSSTSLSTYMLAEVDSNFAPDTSPAPVSRSIQGPPWYLQVLEVLQELTNSELGLTSKDINCLLAALEENEEGAIEYEQLIGFTFDILQHLDREEYVQRLAAESA
jgi:hypothetical protein